MRKMMLSKVLWGAAALLLLLPVCAEEAPPAPTPAATPSLSLQDCLAIALKNQADILVGQNSVQSAKARVTQSKSGYYPQLAVSNTLFVSRAGGNTGGSGLGNTGTGTALSVSQNFYDGGIREANVRGAAANVLQDRYALDRTTQTVTFAVTSDYLAVLRQQKLASVTDAQVKYLQGQLTLVQTRVELGASAKVDTLPVQSSLANALVDQLATRNAVRTAAVTLQNDMGVNPGADFAVQDIVLPTDAPIQSLDAYTALGLAKRPDVLQTKAGVESAKASTSARKILLRPYPVVSGQFDQPLSGSKSNVMTINGGLAFDLFDGGNNRAAYHDAQANLSSAQVRAAQVEKDIRANVQSAYLNLTNAKERLAASDLSVQSAQQNLDAQQERYQQGLAIPLDLLNAQLTLITAQSNAVQARYDYYTALAQIDYATGTQGGLYGK
ncbi:MAG TPA: TolC family protein [Armatimonadota bacterium]|jgi:outer membrane protein TolC